MKNLRFCGPGCECQSCLNLPIIEQQGEEDSGEESVDSVELDSSPVSEEEDSTIIMDEEIITDFDDLFFFNSFKKLFILSVMNKNTLPLKRE